MQMTQVLASFETDGSLAVKIDLDLTLLLGSPARYYALATSPASEQRADVLALVPRVADSLRLYVGDTPLDLEFRGFVAAVAPQADYLDGSLSKPSTFTFVARRLPSGAPLTLRIPLGAEIDYPVAYTVQIPAAHVSVTRWLEDGAHTSAPFEWASSAPWVLGRAGGAVQAGSVLGGAVDPDRLPWYGQLAMYLRLGFRHIVPEGLDHILFVLGLFFLGITWRKLLSQTTVFTLGHATTLCLSAYGIFRLPGWFVEPAIALSITWIALENVARPKLGIGRLAVVFCFGLIHGLGFASSLSDVPFPRKEFFAALLGFNVGVDLGQLFVISLAFLAVGWFRDKPWFRARIAVPCSLVIAAIGLVWAVQRIVV
jgi:hypothetical protein